MRSSSAVLAALACLVAAASEVSGQSSLFDLGKFSLQAAAKNGGFGCADKDTHFELVTGYVYTAPDDMLDSR